MRRGLAMILAIMMMMTLIGTAAGEAQGQKAPDFILEGYDGESTGRTWDTNLFFTRMEEKTGISFEFRESTEYKQWAERKKALANQEDLPDVLFKAEMTAGEVRDLYAAGTLIDLRPYLEEHAPDLWKLMQENPEIEQAIAMPDGAIPALPGINTMQNNAGIWINEKWLNKVKMEMPTTAEELTEVLRAFRDQDPNGNGKQDEVPLAFIGMWELRFLAHAYGIIDNDYYITATDGKVTSSLTSEENRKFLTWLRMLWDEKLIDHNGFSTTDNLRMISDEKADIPYGVIISSTPLTVVPTASAGQYTLIMPLTYNGKQIYRDLTGNVIRGTFAITKRCTAPEKLVAWVNTLYTEEGALMAEYGLEDVEYAWREDGLWEWKEDLTTVAQVILTENTVGSGAAMPGITPVDFQLKYTEELTRKDVGLIAELKKYCVMPYPLVTLTKEDEETLAGVQKELGAYAESTMARFVVGDIEINDAEWETFCKTVKEKGLETVIEIFAKYVK